MPRWHLARLISLSPTNATPQPTRPAPRRSTRALVAVGFGILIAIYVRWRLSVNPMLLAKDFTTPYRAARALADGHNPYDVIKPVGVFPFDEKFLYPLPTAIATLPLERFNVYTAGALFMGISA